jgi:hypothetical protein
MDQLRLPAVLENCSRILIAGAGGGFDVYAGLPVYERLRLLGKDVFLANMSFTYLGGTDAPSISQGLYVVEPATGGSESYFPERTLARFLSRDEQLVRVFAFEKLGVRHIRQGYKLLAEMLRLDAIVLVDGGTDILLRGDEAGLGTPEEDMTSLAAVNGVDVPVRIVMCVGFGIDAFHGVCHANWLENVAELSRQGGLLGATALLKTMPEVQRYIDAVNAAEAATPMRPSIVNGSIVSAIEGRFGNYHRSSRTQSSQLFINPLMTLLWSFDLAAVARRNLYLRTLTETESIWEVEAAIQHFRSGVRVRDREEIPH